MSDDDLVKRLRKNVMCGDAVIEEAADRIEKLVAALRALKALHHDGGIDDLTERDDRTYCMVCDALEGKDD